MTHDEPPAVSDSAPRRWDWRRAARWFGAEFLVVVTGVLVALALNAWWTNRQDDARAETYLRQLDADLTETLAIIDGYDQFLRPVDSTAALLLRAYRTPTPPPADTFATWLLVGTRYGTPRPLLGTAQALVTTGDLGLLSGDSLRSGVVAYLESSQSLLESQAAIGETWRRGFWQVISRLDFADVVIEPLRTPASLDSLARADRYYELPAGPRRRPFPTDVSAVLRDRAVYEALWTMNSSKRSLAQTRSDMRANAAGLRALVTAALDA